MRALISIDYTNDFVADDGALTCGQAAQEIESAMTALAEEFVKAGDYVVFAIDRHEPEDNCHPESKLFPPHNLAGTTGRQLYGALDALYQENKIHKHVRWMDKTRYSAFAGTDLYIRLREKGIEEVHVAGVCTDICVLHTMVDGYNLGFKMVVHENAVASFNSDGHKWALAHFKNSLGAEVV